MPDNKNDRGARDRGRVSAEEKYEVEHLKKKTGASQRTVESAIKKAGPGREKVEKAIRKKAK